jgi:hypothetical protein
MRRTSRRAVLSATVVLGLGTRPPTAGATTGVAQCGTADLSGQLKAGSPGAGQRYATVVLTNTSGHTCTVGGYGGLGLLGAPRQGVPTDLRRVASPAPTTVTLAPGGSARSLLHWTVIPAGDEPRATCEPTAESVAVTPPNQSTALLRSWTFGPVCQHGQIWQNAYVAGSAAF